MQVLEKSMEWLDAWELNVQKELITANEFLTQQTAEGLRVTIN